MTKDQLAAPDNGADVTVTLAISGNRLVSLLNTVDAMLFASGTYRYVDNKLITANDRYEHLRATTEAIRDELSRQRCANRN